MEIPQILKTYHTVAVVGASPDPDRTSNHVFMYMKKHGYRVIPVNPRTDEVSGEKCYPSLTAIPEKIEIVDILGSIVILEFIMNSDKVKIDMSNLKSGFYYLRMTDKENNVITKGCVKK